MDKQETTNVIPTPELHDLDFLRELLTSFVIKSKPLIYEIGLLSTTFKDKPNNFQIASAIKEKSISLINLCNKTTAKADNVARDSKDNQYLHLISTATHDIKGPLSNFYGFTDLWPELDFQTREEMSNSFYINSQEFSRVLDFVIELQAHIGEQLEYKTINLFDIIETLHQGFKATLLSEDMTLENRLNPELIVVGHPSVREILKNYISNAIKYAHDGHKIVVDYVNGGPTATTFVRDFGSKILMPEEQNRIFERNYQTCKDNHGQGLGLAISKYLADINNGFVGVQPNTPRGNAFYLTMQLAE